MKKLGKKLDQVERTIEAYGACACGCGCTCSGNLLSTGQQVQHYYYEFNANFIFLDKKNY